MILDRGPLLAPAAAHRLIARRVGRRAVPAIGALAAVATLTLAVATGTVAAQTGVIAAPTLVTVPDDYTIDATPTWTFTGDPRATFGCTLSQPFVGAWAGGSNGEEPEPPPVIIDSRACDSGGYTFDLSSYPDALYSLEVTQADASGTTSEPASDWFYLDRFAYAPIIRTSPDEVSNDPTPTWTFYYYGEYLPQFECTLTRAGATSPVSDGGCSRESFTFDLNAYPDDTYTLSVTLTDPGGNTSDAVTDTFVLDRTTPNAAPSASFLASCGDLTCRFDARASGDSDGQIVSYRWDFGDGTSVIQSAGFPEAWHGYNGPGSYSVTLTVTDNANATAVAFQTVSVGNPPAPNAPPAAAFAVSCAGLSCSVDAGESADPDGTITSYAWEFGDGASATGKTTQHSYAAAAGDTIKLTVTEDDGASVTASTVVALIRLTARGYKQHGVRKIELSWNAVRGTSYDVYRNGAVIATVYTTTYTDNSSKPGSFTYGVCAAAMASCSNQVTVSF